MKGCYFSLLPCVFCRVQSDMQELIDSRMADEIACDEQMST